ncbi:flagellar biosynthesis regulator FlaF [Rhodovulum adriaticum]|uniref:Flagellar protein FlaF n=1 Tax=Rhodovulum adriaticum TaxID=35804 RepID=A0A4V6NQM1_RHOAD|nr:flagellar biosynthesis regulator FlaF [Rhodovulum adriaticum]MBK1634759.1 flagellar biosynthesis regulator FlhF [Rhodovulum adriaticum]TCP27666.1 flagellar protein FlaF [Rhodovulum adriaticum]
MNALHMAQTAYSAPNQAHMRSPRATEYAAFTRITARLKEAAATDPVDFPALAAALDQNRKLWRVLAMDVADPANGLPDTLRARLFYLFEFTDQHTAKVLARTADAAPLIEVNTAIMRGLSGAEIPR